MDFATALEGKASDYEPPKLQPIGTYVWSVSKPFENKEVGQGTKYDMVTFFVQCVSATEDVDPDELKEFGNITKLPQRVTFLFTKDPDEQNAWDRTMNDLKTFLYSYLMVDETDLLKADMASATNMQFLGTIKHVVDKRTEGAFQAEIGAKAPL